MQDIKPAVDGQSINGIMTQMSSDYKTLCRSGKNLLGDAKLFCSIMKEWIRLDWWRKWYNEDKETWYTYSSFKEFIETGGREGLGLWLEREGKDLQLLVKAGIPGAELIWTMWLEKEAEEGRGLAEHGEIGNGRGESRGDNVTTTQRGNNSEYTMSRLIRDVNSDNTPEERRQELLPLLNGIKEGSLSVHKAAIAAGYRKQKSAKDQAIYWIDKCTDEEREDVAAYLQSLSFEYAD